MDELNMDVKEQKEDIQTIVARFISVDESDEDFDDEESDDEEEVFEEQEVFEGWKEEKEDDGTKWHFLKHNGPFFAPDYVPLPSNVKFYYDDQEMKLSLETEEVATFYARMLKHDYTNKHDYTTKKVFNDNFFHDWREIMTESEKSKITDWKKCNFRKIYNYFTRKLSEEEEKAIAEKKQEIKEQYGFCIINEDKEKIKKFKIEPPGIFIGRGENPKMGKLKKRVQPEDVTINCSVNSDPKAPEGHKWKSVIYNQKRIWLASWTDNILGKKKYVRLSDSSKLSGKIDLQKFDTAKNLAKNIYTIRENYRKDWESKNEIDMQAAIALYFIDKLALRPGDENNENTYGCCDLKVKHVQLHEEKNGKECVVEFDFLGKDSIRYHEDFPVEKLVFKNLKLFKERNSDEDKLFDHLSTNKMNKYLNKQMTGLTAKVFRTFQASFTLQTKLEELTNSKDSEDSEDSIQDKIRSCEEAIKVAARLCNHIRTNRKTGEVEVAIENTKRYYIDPRIIVAWCINNDVPIERIYSPDLRKKFQWAIDKRDRNFKYESEKFLNTEVGNQLHNYNYIST